MKNSILILQPYLLNGIWVFDSKDFNLVKEPFVGQVNRWIDDLVKGIPGAESGFNLIFSAEPFPDFMAEYNWSHEEYGGNTYFHAKSQSFGWLCPCLEIIMGNAPQKIYARAEPFRA